MKNLLSFLQIAIIIALFSNLTFAQQFEFSTNLSGTGSECAPKVVNFTISNPPLGTAYFTWDWDDGSNNISYGDTTHTFSTGGEFRVRIEARNGFGNYLDSYDESVFIGGLPNKIETQDTFCVGENMYFRIPSIYDTYNWDFGDGNTSFNVSRATHLYNTAGNYTVKVALTSSCISGSDTVYKPIVVGTNVPINVNNNGVDINLSTNIICQNDSVKFNINGPNIFTETYERLWDLGDGSVSQAEELSHSYSVKGTKYINIKFTNACLNSAAIYDTIYVRDSLPISGTQTDIFPNPSCPGGNIRFSSYSQNAGQYSWNLLGGNPSSVNQEVNFSYQNPGTYFVGLTVSNGCPFSADSSYVYPVVVQDGLPYSGELGTFITPTEACPGDTISFYAYEQTATDYLWNFGDGTTENKPFAYHTFTTTGTKPVSTIFTNGCGSDTVLTTLIKIKNNVFPKLIPEGNNNSNNGPVFGSFGTPNQSGSACPNDSNLFFVFGQYATITWDFGDGTSTNEFEKLYVNVDPQIPYSFPVNLVKHSYSTVGNYTAKITVSNACGNTASDSMQVNITNNLPVSVDFAPLPPQNGNTYVPCEYVEFISFNGETYSWDFGDGSTLITTNANISHQYMNSGTYNVSLSITNGCGQTATRTLPIYIQETGSPFANFTASPLTGLAPLAVQFSNLSKNADLYEWTFSDGTTSNQVNPLHVFTEVGSYNVTLKASTVCGTNHSVSQINYITTTAVSISGTVYDDTITNPVTTGEVTLYRKKANGLFDSLRTVSINTDGTYTFPNALKGQYFILAKPSTTTYPTLLATYHYDQTQWYNADPVVADQDITGIDIICQPISTSGTGTGRIYGNVIQGNTTGKTGKVQGPGDPFNGIDVSLIDKSTGSAVAQQTSGTNSGNDGGFDFTDVTNDTFGIYVGVTGVPTDAGFEIPINASNQSVYVVVIVDSNLISFNTTSIENVKKANNIDDFTVFPNPYEEYTNIVYTLREKSDVKLEVFSMIGERVKLIEYEVQNKGTYNYTFSGKANNLSQGFYIIRLKADNTILTQKVLEIKQ